MTDPTREAFEAWYAKNDNTGKSVARDATGYRLIQTQSAWEAWQAALSARAQGEADGRFAEWLAHEMPAGTVIGDPAWWANRIARQYAKRATPTVRAVDVDEAMVNHIVSVIDGTLAHCEAKSTSEETSYIGGQCLSELANIRDALTQPEAE